MNNFHIIFVAFRMLVYYCFSYNTVTVTEPPPKRQESLYLTDNIGYGASFGEQDEVIYDEIGDIGVGSRRHAVYGGNTEDANDMESYSVYDVVL